MTKPSEPTGWRSIELYNKITLGVALPAFGKAAWKPLDRKSTRLNSSHANESRMPSSA